MEYIITFVGSLIVALVTVWISHLISAKREYHQALENLRSEIKTNMEASKLITQWVDTNKESLQDGQLVVATCPHLYDQSWVNVKGRLTTKDYGITTELETVYFLITIVNDLLRIIFELKWGIGAVMTGTQTRRETVLECLEDTINTHLSPKLIEAKKTIDNKLK